MSKLSLYLVFGLLFVPSIVFAAYTKCYVLQGGTVCLNATTISSPYGNLTLNSTANNYPTNLTVNQSGSSYSVVLGRNGLGSLMGNFTVNSSSSGGGIGYVNVTGASFNSTNWFLRMINDTTAQAAQVSCNAGDAISTLSNNSVCTSFVTPAVLAAFGYISSAPNVNVTGLAGSGSVVQINLSNGSILNATITTGGTGNITGSLSTNYITKATNSTHIISTSIYENSNDGLKVNDIKIATTNSYTLCRSRTTLNDTNFNYSCDYVCYSYQSDCTDTIQSAVNYLTNTGGKIIIRNGVYEINNTILLNKNGITIEGESYGGDKYNDSNAVLIQAINFSNGKNMFNLTGERTGLINLVINGSADTNYGVYISGGENFLQRIHVRKQGSTGIFAENTGDAESIMRDVMSSENGLHGIELQRNDWALDRVNSIRNYYGAAIMLNKGSSTQIMGSHPFMNRYGIYLNGTNAVTIVNNIIEQNTDAGIYIENSPGLTGRISIIGNTFYSNSYNSSYGTHIFFNLTNTSTYINGTKIIGNNFDTSATVFGYNGTISNIDNTVFFGNDARTTIGSIPGGTIYDTVNGLIIENNGQTTTNPGLSVGNGTILGSDGIGVLKIGNSLIYDNTATADLTLDSPTTRIRFQDDIFVGGNDILDSSGTSRITLGTNTSINTNASVTGNLSVTGNGNFSGFLYESTGRVCTSSNGMCGISSGNISGSGTSNYISKWTNSTNLAVSLIYESGSNIGIGNTNPNQTLDISGTLNVSSTIYSSGNINLQNQSKINIGTGSAFITNGATTQSARIVINGGSQTLNLDSLPSIFWNYANPQIDLYSTSNNTLQIRNTNTGDAFLTVEGNITAQNSLCIGSDCRSSWPSGAGNVTSSNGTAGYVGVFSSATNLVALLINSTMIGDSVINRTHIYTSNSGSQDQVLTINSTGGLNWSTPSTGISSSGGNASINGDGIFGTYVIQKNSSEIIDGNLTENGVLSYPNNATFSKYLNIGGTVFPYNQPRRFKIAELEFLRGGTNTGGIESLALSTFSSGASAGGTGEANHPGVLILQDSATANGGSGIFSDVAAFLLAGGENFTVVFQIRSGQTGNSTTKIGFHDIAGAGWATDGCYWSFDNWGVGTGGPTRSAEPKCANNNAQTKATNFTYTNNTWYVGNIYVNPTATNVTFTIMNETGGVLQSNSITSNIPTAAGRETGAGVIFTQNTTSAAAAGVYLDYLSLVINRELNRGLEQ